MVACSIGRVRERLPILKFFKSIEELDRNKRICFFQRCRAPLVEALDLVDN